MNLRHTYALLLLTIAGLAVSCAQERAPINRVQPYALRKAYFVGEKLVDTSDDPEFWSRTTVTDVGYGAAQDGLFTSTYAQPMARLKWQITEGLLIGRLSYERIIGSDGKGAGKLTQNGVIAAAFKITSHFDIRHAYNSGTGEEMNVVEENTVDRPWYEREYIHVDWSQNLNVDSYDFDTLSMMGVFGGIQYESLAYDVVDPSAEDAPYFADDGSYFDITTKAFAKPGIIDLSALGWGIDSYPACFLDADFSGGQAPAGSCNPIELTLRHSFRRVVDSDYEPKDWDGQRFDAAGIFTEDRQGYARNYGLTDDMYHRFAARYNIWERSHYYTDPVNMTGFVPCYTDKTTPYGADPHRDLNSDGTEDECAAVTTATKLGGSTCDTFRQRCTLPYQARVQKPIAWYYADGSNPTYFPGTEDATHEWDVAMRAAVQEAKYAECMRTSPEGTDCAKTFPIWYGQQDDNDDAIALAREVDDCRHGIAYPDRKGAESACVALADEIGKKRGLASGVIAISKMPEMVVLCHSPVEANDPAICALPTQRLAAGVTAEACFNGAKNGDRDLVGRCNAALHVRRGDLRYHQVNGIVEPATPSPWGIMVDGVDPVNGEKVSASINVWTYVNELWSQGVVDMARYAAGELKTSDITEGKYIRNWSMAAEAASKGGMLPGLSDEQVRDIQHASGRPVDVERAAQFAAQHPQPTPFDAQAREIAENVVATYNAPSASAPIYQARRNAAAGTAYEAALMTPMMQQFFGVSGMALTPGLMAMVSPLQGGNPTVQRHLRHMKENALAARGACVMEMAEAPLAIAGLSDVLQDKFGAFEPEKLDDKQSDDAWHGKQQGRAEAMRKYLAQRVHYAVIIHEMGHSIGLRHNFVSSADAFNFRPQYWQLRTRDGDPDVSKNKCTSLKKEGDAENCVGPRYFDPVTPNERNNLIWMWMQSSVMDYAGESTQDLLGLGAYDFHAASMFYGDVAAVFRDPSYRSDQARGVGVHEKMDDFGGIVGLQPAIGTSKKAQDGYWTDTIATGSTTNIHYSQLQKSYELIRNDTCVAVDPNNWKPGRWQETRDGKFHPMLDGLLVKNAGTDAYTRCRTQEVDYVQWSQLRYPTTKATPKDADHPFTLPAEASQYYRGGPSVVAKDGRVRVPYGFASDNWADLGNASVYRHDNGADNYEIFNFMITQPEVNHIFDNYRRGRKSFAIRTAFNRSLTRYYEKMRDGAKGLGLIRNSIKNSYMTIGQDPEAAWNQFAPQYWPEALLASAMVFDHFTRIEQRPEAGAHLRDGDGILRAAGQQSSPQGATEILIPNGATGYMGQVSFGGRLLENTLATDKGDYNSRYTLNAGSYYEKASVAMLLTESEDNFISAQLGDFYDSRGRACSIADLFPEGYRRFLGNALTGDDFVKGARIGLDKSASPDVDADQYPKRGIGWTSWYGATPLSCFPGEGSTICRTYGKDTGFGNINVAAKDEAVIDPQIGYEQQKFLIAWTFLYLFENDQQDWLNQMRLWELGTDSNPDLGNNRIEFHHPGGKTYLARTFGKETIFGKLVQKGVGARVLEHANELLKAAYFTVDGPDLDGDGTADWTTAEIDAKTGQPRVRCSGGGSACECSASAECVRLAEYVEVPFFLRQSIDAYGLDPTPHQKSIYP